MSEQAQPIRERTLAELFKELLQEVSTLIRQEAALARTELSAKAARAGKHAGLIAAGGAVAYAGLLVLLTAVVLLLAQLGMTAWLAALLVGVAAAGVGAALAVSGLNALKHADLAPRETMESLEDVKEDLRGTTSTRNRAAG